MKDIEPEFLYIAGVIIVISLVLWVVALFVVYLLDDWHSPAADERSVPATRQY